MDLAITLLFIGHVKNLVDDDDDDDDDEVRVHDKRISTTPIDKGPIPMFRQNVYRTEF